MNLHALSTGQLSCCRSVGNGHATVHQFTDGLPLAIELAAARRKILTPQALLARLTATGSGKQQSEGLLDALTGGAQDLSYPFCRSPRKWVIQWVSQPMRHAVPHPILL